MKLDGCLVVGGVAKRLRLKTIGFFFIFKKQIVIACQFPLKIQNIHFTVKLSNGVITQGKTSISKSLKHISGQSMM